MIFCKNCKHYKYNKYAHKKRCDLEVVLELIPHLRGIYEETLKAHKNAFSKNHNHNCPNYKVKWWKALFVKNVEKYKKV